MESMFRSEKMALCQLFVQPEAAYDTVSELGERGVVQFRDLNPEVNAFQRKFANEVKRCNEMERKLRYIDTQLKKDEVQVPEIRGALPLAPNPRDFINLEAQLEKTENEIVELSENGVDLKLNFLELTELKQVLEKTENFFVKADGQINAENIQSTLIKDELNAQQEGLGFVAGVIQRERVAGFERMLWRISRGNVFLRQAELDTTLEDPATGKPLSKTVFVAFFQGEQLKSRIKKVCAGYHASLYPCPSAPEEREDMLKGVQTRLEDLNMVLNQTKDHRQRVLVTVAKELPTWFVMLRKMKAIYYTLNLFNMDVSKKCLIGECWVPVNDLSIVRSALSEGSQNVGSTIPSFMNIIQSNETPPTYNRSNRFTKGFQQLIDSYGFASYREVNPALYTIITFPFLFAVMFGDIGHGLVMFLFALWMVIREISLASKKNWGEIWEIIFYGRYIILLMGIFSIYTGFIYNDVFSKSMNIFGSSWRNTYNYTTIANNTQLQLSPSTDALINDTYPFGMDPAWQLGTNKIIFFNSYKMKLSIIFGVFHMIFGVCLSTVNMIHFGKISDLFLVFIPQILFLVLLFAYMVFMMFFKWILYTAKTHDLVLKPGCAPSVLIMFINMMLFKEGEPLPGCKEFMFDAQPTVQMIFLGVAVACIPVMLLGKPILIWFNRRKSSIDDIDNGNINSGMDMASEPEDSQIQVSTSTASAKNEHDEEPMSEVFIGQAIHTIEYVLETISHTASYLRLWALSLAHGQLSEILWTKIFNMALILPLPYGGSIFIYIAFAAWASLTVGILVVIEGLSAFLHTLRLHWVEFMSKFYKGLGYIFQPFSFAAILEAEESSE